ncbi:MAG: hypothetical protein EOP48_04965, partial [Sphingobacteriales bacterium]
MRNSSKQDGFIPVAMLMGIAALSMALIYFGNASSRLRLKTAEAENSRSTEDRKSGFLNAAAIVKGELTPFKDRDKKVWTQQYREPSFALASDDKGNIWMGTWNAVWLADGQSLKKINGTNGPISILCHSPSGMYAIGPKGIWLFNGSAFVKQQAVVPRSVRDAVADENGGLWLASDVGLYHVVK